MTRTPTSSNANRLTQAVQAWENGTLEFDDLRTEVLELAEQVQQAADGFEAMTSLLHFNPDEDALFVLDAATEFVESCWDILDGDPQQGLQLAHQALEVLESSSFLHSVVSRRPVAA